MSERRAGFVSLVGAGPGDPELLTLGGAERLSRADVIVFDRLANPSLLSHAREDAERIDAGKRADAHTLTQSEINALLVDRARAGRRVVRLKGGDPFVFGRGGEEAEALIAAGIPFEVLPGVTSAIAAPAYAGIPITHRALSSSFAVVTAHEDPAKDATTLDWAHLAHAVDTLVVLMGAARLGAIAGTLIAHGRDAATPAAVVEWGTHPRQRVVTGTLATISAEADAAAIEAPAVIVVGAVAALRDDLRWFDNRPLSGTRVLVTRAQEQAAELSRLLAEQGAEPVVLPSIEIVPAPPDDALARAIDDLRSAAFSWAIFTSANGVSLMLRHLRVAGLDARTFGRTRIAAIGPGTAAALDGAGLRPDLLPPRFVAEGLLEALAAQNLRGQRLLLPRAADARMTLPEGLAALGARVTELKLYRAAVPRAPQADALRRLRSGQIEIATFASPSAVRNLIAMLDGDTAPLARTRIAVIGPVTEAAVRDAGLTPHIAAEEYTLAGLVQALVRASARARV